MERPAPAQQWHVDEPQGEASALLSLTAANTLRHELQPCPGLLRWSGTLLQQHHLQLLCMCVPAAGSMQGCYRDGLGDVESADAPD